MAKRVDPYKNFRFLVEIDGIAQAGFSDCTGFGSSVEVIEYREGGDSATVNKLPGKATYPDITLKRGVTDSRDLYDWHLAGINGIRDQRNGSIIQLDDLGQEKVRWNFFEAWPSKYEGPSFSGKGNEVSIDSITISCQRLVRA